MILELKISYKPKGRLIKGIHIQTMRHHSLPLNVKNGWKGCGEKEHSPSYPVGGISISTAFFEG